MFRCALALVILSMTVYAAFADSAPFETKARQALVFDQTASVTLYAKNPDDPFPPASLAKLMTMEVVFHLVSDGSRSLEDVFVVSEDAWRRGGAPSGGSTMFAKPKSEARLEDLMRGVIIQSANDGSIAIADGIAGGEGAFAALMTARAREIGLKNAVFKNATGLPAEGQMVTARDLLSLARHLWSTYPDLYPLFSETSFTWNKITQRNRNPLLFMGMGADGLMTGYTEASGYALVASVVKGERRLFIVLSGLASESERSVEARRIVNWAFESFEAAHLFGADDIVGRLAVYGGESGEIGVKAAQAVTALIPRGSPEAASARIVYDGPLVAPIAKGAEVGVLQVWIGGTLSQSRPVYAAEAVERGGLTQRAYDAAKELLTGWLRPDPST
jgi:D-alanyl-D-alanine carboxypeptidase (penicillin-binding protein 5/6)